MNDIRDNKYVILLSVKWEARSKYKNKAVQSISISPAMCQNFVLNIPMEWSMDVESIHNHNHIHNNRLSVYIL